jgi:hypothetical protein
VLTCVVYGGPVDESGIPRRRDCPECRAIGSVVLGVCNVCFAEVDEGGPVRISASLSWDLDLDEPVLEPGHHGEGGV